MTLHRILFLDAASCIGMGLMLVFLAELLAPPLGLPALLLSCAGFALLPVGAFMAWAATRTVPPPASVRIIILGNAAWVAGSVALLVVVSPTAPGYAFVLSQAGAVAVLTGLEYLKTRVA